MKLDPNDKIVGVEICKDDQDIMLSTKNGKCIRLESKKLRIFKGRSSKGIKGLELAPNDEIVSLSIIDQEKIKMFLSLIRKQLIDTYYQLLKMDMVKKHLILIIE